VNTALSARERAQLAQRLASDPGLSAWVAASAGSGKTKVLTDRVLRLLLQDGQLANRLLCLTFTKAAAAEMQTRLARRLGEWACAEDAALTLELERLTGLPPAPALLNRARKLFAEVLELPGGMRISTIHAFCQSLLRAFPLEAGLPPQFSVIEEADSAGMLADARETVLANGAVLGGELTRVAGLVSADEFAKVIGALLQHRDRLGACLREAGALRGRLATVLGLAPDECEEQAVLDAACALEEAPLCMAASLLGASRNDNDQQRGARIRDWLALKPVLRRPRWEGWCDIFLTKAGEPRTARSLLTKQVGARYDEVLAALQGESQRILAVQERLAAARLLTATEALLALGTPVLAQYESRKARSGLLAYDDLVAIAQRVLKDPGSAWVLFKLDGGLDHVLLDEAQDTNPAQWGITAALTEEFFAGEGVTERQRTIFAVGDVKQSIYSFQGADPAGFTRWRDTFGGRMRILGQELAQVQLDVSFRSTAPVLALVDAVFADGPARQGVVADGEPLEHRPDRAGHAGLVELWPLLRKATPPKPEPWVIPEAPERAAGAEAQLAEALAGRIARMIHHERLEARCLDIARPEARRIRPGDILVLVRRRTRFVQLLVRALKERQVPVGGVDRLQLVEQIAVQDLLALCDVLLLPDDDLQLAALLKSPLCGVEEEDLLALAWQRPGSLWAALLRHRGGETALGRAADWLAKLADRADLITPHSLLAEVLGEHGGRARLLARLGPDAADPLDEVLNAALTYERQHPPSLQGFVHWLRRGNAEIKREAEGGADAVRIMTVHGAKGLQAPVVILPDVGSGRGGEMLRWVSDNGIEVPLWAPNNRKEFRSPAFAALLEAEAKARAEEENRLLYVALTRAEDRLLVCGWGEPKPETWHGLVRSGFARLGETVEQAVFDPQEFGAPAGCDFGAELLLRLACVQAEAPVPDRAVTERLTARLPEWASRPAPPEVAAINLQPSALPGEQEETPAAAPHGQGDPLGRRFRRGRLLHALLQHLPERAEAEREAAARAFLARPGHGLSAEEQAEALAEVLALLATPELRAAFGPDSLAEAPIAGRVGGVLIAGQVDRLVIGPDRVLVLDYKTNRPPPAELDQVPALYLRQMAAYRAVLRQAFPGRAVDCALVWTYGARLMPLPHGLLDTHAPAAETPPT
jgi:ATP-dependent helicase/nuclease subunit A